MPFYCCYYHYHYHNHLVPLFSQEKRQPIV
jgi:hypothetical protein